MKMSVHQLSDRVAQARVESHSDALSGQQTWALVFPVENTSQGYDVLDAIRVAMQREVEAGQASKDLARAHKTLELAHHNLQMANRDRSRLVDETHRLEQLLKAAHISIGRAYMAIKEWSESPNVPGDVRVQMQAWLRGEAR